MPTRSWNFAGAGSWFTVADWTTTPPAANNFPQPGDTVFVNLGTPAIDASHGTIDQLQVGIGSNDPSAPAHVVLQNAALGSAFAIASGPGAGFGGLQVSGTSTLAGTIIADAAGGLFTIAILDPGTLQDLTSTGTIGVSNGDTIQLQAGLDGALISTGSVIANGGTFLVADQATFVNSGTVVVSGDGAFKVASLGTIQGTGTISIAGGSTVTIGNAFPYAQTIAFLDGTGTLALGDPSGFAGGITGFQLGDVLDLINSPNNWIDYISGKLYLGAAGSDGKPLTIRLAAPAGATIGAKSDGNGGTLIQIAADRTWTGAQSDEWYNAANWSTAPPFANGVPGPGDVATLHSGTATISNADVGQFGPLNDVQIIIGGIGAPTPILQATGETIGAGSSINTLRTTNSNAELDFFGTTTLKGAITARAVGGLLTLRIGSDGTGANLIVAGPQGKSSGAVIDSSSESGLSIIGSGTLTNNALIQVGGGLTVAAGVNLLGTGLVQIVGDGNAVLNGAVGSGQTVEFDEVGETLVIGDASNFQATISGIISNDTIDLVGLTGSLSFNASTSVLDLVQGPTVEASLQLFGTYDGTLFQQASDGNGGTDITYSQPPDQFVTTVSLPVPAIGAAGTEIALGQLLTNAFGTIPANFITNGVTLSYTNAEHLAQNNLSYWDPTKPSVTSWLVNGTNIGNGQVVVSGSQLDTVTLQLGNNILPQAFVEVPVSFGQNGSPTAYVNYQIATVDPAVMRADYNTNPPTPADILSTATAFANTYVNVPNNNDCPSISADVGAGAGAVHPAEDASTNPELNLSGGFWRIVYQGTQPGQVANWYTQVQPGDFVRMGWFVGSPHTTTIIGNDGTIDTTGSIGVYDNIDPLSDGFSGIGFHDAQYWPTTNPSTITIYRLDPNQQYLINGTSPNGEIIQGSIYNDLIEPLAGADTITGGAGNDEVQGIAPNLGGDSITDWHIGDTIDLTDIAPDQVDQFGYDPASGVLSLQAGIVNVALTLTKNQTGPFNFRTDGSGGTLISEAQVPCYAAGTRIRTPSGDVPIEALREGDLVLTLRGEALPIVWLGRRVVDCARHMRPELVWPVRIRAGAFAKRTPARDLWLSPDHAVFVDDVLVPVKYLIDGDGIAQVPVEQITYFHLELPRHAVVLAENLPAETYLDTGDRGRFANGGQVVALYPDFASRVWEAAGYAALVVAGPELVAIRRRLARRARAGAKAGAGVNGKLSRRYPRSADTPRPARSA